MKSDFYKNRTRVVSFFIILFVLILIYRLYSLQVVNGSEFREKADRQYVSAPTNTFDRGIIYFEDKDKNLVSAGSLMSGYYLAIVPKDIKYPEDIYNLLSSVVDIDADEFLKKAQKTNDPFEEIERRLTEEEARKISELNIDAVRIYKEKWRYYPFNELAAQTLGFVAYNNDKLSGRYGLERQYDNLLSKDNDGSNVNFFADVFLNLKENIFTNEAKGDLITTIEPTVQSHLSGLLDEIQNKYDSKITGGIVIDPNTGEIFAMGSVPTFDLNNFNKQKDISIYANPLVESVYEMGSIIKPLTVTAGIDSGAIKADSTYNDTGTKVYNGSRISNYDGVARGEDTPVQEILSQSLNIGVAWIMEEMGIDNFSKYFKSFDFDKKTKIDLPNETAGLADNLNSTRKIEHATASFGQGIAMTPVSVVRALSTIANGGNLITPHIGKEIRLKTGIRKELKYPEAKKIFSKQSTDEVTKMLIKVVDESLKNGEVRLKNYTVAAKTGTAQMADNTNGGYYDDRYLHSFFGFFPARQPEFLVFLYTVDPKEVRYASETLTDGFMDMTKFLLNYYEVAPDRNV